MRHWMYTFNSHLGYTPVLRVHYPRYLTEMVGYLTDLNH
jgi:hypothetical protein